MRNGLVARGIAGVVVIAAVFSLAACTPGTVVRSLAHTAAGTSFSSAGSETYPGDSGYSESGFEPVEVSGPTDWNALQPCGDVVEGGAWALVSTFPADEIDNAGIFPFCGDTFIVDDGDNYVSAVATTTQYEIFLLGGKLASAGWTLGSDDFETLPLDGTGEYVGAREYTLGDQTLVLSAYDNGVHPASLTLFIDFYSPQTQALGGAQT